MFTSRALKMAALSGAVMLACATSPVAQSAGADDLSLTLPEARSLAVRALNDGEPQIAAQVAKGLLQAEPDSSFAHFVLAHAHSELGQTARARSAAAKAYRYADDPAQRFQSADLAAKLAYRQGRPTTAQLWLRRAVQNTDDPQIEQQLGRDYSRLRRENPLSFSLRGAIRPSSNVNNGSDTAVQIIDGIPVTGRLSGSAQALSGTIGTADTSLSYRLRGTAKSRTDISGRLFLQRVALSSGAQSLSPTSSNSDFGSTFASVTLSHSFTLGDTGGSARIAGTAGQFWSGGERFYDFGRVDVSRSWNLDARNSLQLAASVEDRDIVNSDLRDSLVFGLTATMAHVRSTGDRLQFSLNLVESNSDSVNTEFQSASLRATYSFAKQIGPAQISAGFVLGKTDYDSFFAAPIFLPDGRNDESAFADINLFFPDFDYAGFAPTIAIRAGRKSSNISRFDTRELSVSLGIQSKF
ncbi:MAG: hypothetical protein WBG95_15855 [Sulfitobacter sp.]